jgi:DNA-binding MarR family transcriptional regulator
MDPIIHQPLRLKIMAALYAAQQLEPLEFTRLKALVRATDGNLGSHLGTLEAANYILVEKGFAGKRPQTRVTITPLGARAFREHTNYLREIIEAVETRAPGGERDES